MSGDPISVPSGRAVTLYEVIRDVPGPSGATMRFHFVIPELDKEGDLAMLESDMTHLCEQVALPHLQGAVPPVEQVIIALSDRPVPFGQTAPEATQFFEAYRSDGTTCIWEGF